MIARTIISESLMRTPFLTGKPSSVGWPDANLDANPVASYLNRNRNSLVRPRTDWAGLIVSRRTRRCSNRASRVIFAAGGGRIGRYSLYVLYVKG